MKKPKTLKLKTHAEARVVCWEKEEERQGKGKRRREARKREKKKAGEKKEKKKTRERERIKKLIENIYQFLLYKNK